MENREGTPTAGTFNTVNVAGGTGVVAPWATVNEIGGPPASEVVRYWANAGAESFMNMRRSLDAELTWNLWGERGGFLSENA
jgi:hypothetical protein